MGGSISCYGKCGAEVQWKTTKRVFCPSCRLEVIRRRAREGATVKRLAAGIKPVKGTEFKCVDCGVSGIRYSVRTKRCATCQTAEVTRRTRAASASAKGDPARRALYNEWFRKKRETDPAYRVTSHFRVLMHRALKGKKAGRSWKSFVDYSLDDLMRHLERQFLPGMTWENYGTMWHIDHIVPRSLFDYDSPEHPEFKAAWALWNLRPLGANDNIRKNARRTHLI